LTSSDGWTIEPKAPANPFTTCGTVMMFGGYGLFNGAYSITKALKLSPHY
jgi:hypothetical protein